jgi:hypothetical protein
MHQDVYRIGEIAQIREVAKLSASPKRCGERQGVLGSVKKAYFTFVPDFTVKIQ